MARTPWYYKDIVIPWRSKQTASHIVITNDPIREVQITRDMVVEMILTIFLENVRNYIAGRPVPRQVDYYMVNVITPQSAYVSRYSFYVDMDSIRNLSSEQLKEIQNSRNPMEVINRLYKEGVIRLEVEGLVVTRDGTPVKRRVDMRKTLPQPIPQTFNPRTLALTDAEDISKIQPIPLNHFSQYLLRRYYFDPPEVAVFGIFTNTKLNERDLNERAVPIILAKDVAKHPAVIRKGSLFVAVVPSLSFVPESLRNIVNIVDKSYAERAEIRGELEKAVNMLKRRGLVPKSFRVTEELVDSAVGLSLDEIQSAIMQSIYLHGEIKPEVFRDMKIQKLASMGVRYIEPKHTLEDVGGMRIIKEEIRKRIIELSKNKELAEKYNIPPPRGFLLAGIGGTGKSWFVKALAGELGRPVIQLNASDFMSKYVGESEQNLRRILKLADEINAIVFIDEIDAIAMSRETVSAGDSGVTRRIINQIMEFLGDRDRRAMVIGATNVIEQMDVNFLRAGRFDKIFHVSPPDMKARKEILRIHGLKLNPPQEGIKFEDGVFDRVAQETHLWTGAELEALVNEAKYCAIMDNSDVIKYEHFKKAMENFHINIEQRKEQIRRSIEALEERLPQGIVVRATLEEARMLLGEKVKVAETGMESARFMPTYYPAPYGEEAEGGEAEAGEAEEKTGWGDFEIDDSEYEM